MDRARAGVVFTDPPYNVRIDGNVSGKGQIHHLEFATDFLAAAFMLLIQHSHEGSMHSRWWRKPIPYRGRPGRNRRFVRVVSENWRPMTMMGGVSEC
jgi:hypothetical protein